MVLRAAWRLDAVCQRCAKPLRTGAAAVRDIRIPIFGDTLAGKTRFLYAALDSLIATALRAGIELTFPDDDSRAKAEQGLTLLRASRDTAKTTVELPKAISCRLGSGAAGSLLHLFDAAGERFRSAAAQDELGFMESGHALVYVLDPFAIGAVRDRLTGHDAAVLSLARAANGDPESTYGEVVTRLRSNGVEPGKQRLAVVVSKSDLLEACSIGPLGEDAAIAEWLYENGLHNLVLASRRDFAEVCYFTVASLSAAQSTPSTDAGAPLRWLLRSRGVRLPEPSPLVEIDPEATALPAAESV
jgi:hypothetical protein